MGVIFNKISVLRRKLCLYLSEPRLPGGRLLLLWDQRELWRAHGAVWGQLWGRAAHGGREGLVSGTTALRGSAGRARIQWGRT